MLGNTIVGYNNVALHYAMSSFIHALDEVLQSETLQPLFQWLFKMLMNNIFQLDGSRGASIES